MYPAIFWKCEPVLLLLTRVTFQWRLADFRDDTALLKYHSSKMKTSEQSSVLEMSSDWGGCSAGIYWSGEVQNSHHLFHQVFFFFFFAAAPFNRAEPQPAEEEMKLNRVSDGNPSSQHIYFVSTEQSICGECAASEKNVDSKDDRRNIYIYFFLSCDLRD